MSGTETKNKYEVTIIDPMTQSHWTMMFMADDFGHAEEQALNALESNGSKHDEIYKITREFV